MVMACQVAGQSGRWVQNRSATWSLPCSCRINTASAVNCLVSDAIRNRVSGSLGTSRVTSAWSYPCRATPCRRG